MIEEELNLTPAMKQYYDIKKEYDDSILFFRMWDFYEMFDEDAHIAHKVLGVAITTRNKNALKPTPLAGIPYHAKEKYLPLLVEAWYKVAIAEQVSDPKLKWIVKREVVRVVTPATIHLEGDEYAKNVSSSYIISMVEENGIYGISALDLTNNTWVTSEFSSFEKMSWEVYKIWPKEVILEKKLFQEDKIKTIFQKKQNLNIYFFEPKLQAKNNLINHFWVKNLIGFWLEEKFLAIKASSLLIEYIEKNQKSQVTFLKEIRYESFSEFLEVDESTLKNLDIFFNIVTKSKKQGTLYWLLNETKTSAGSRFLWEALMKPEKNLEVIKERQNAIAELLKNKLILDKISEKLKYVSDIDSILNRLALGRASARDLLHLKKSIEMILEIKKLIASSNLEKIKEIIL